VTAIGRLKVVTNGCYADAKRDQAATERQAAPENPDRPLWVVIGCSRRRAVYREAVVQRRSRVAAHRNVKQLHGQQLARV
jgi:hypothetical protein